MFKDTLSKFVKSIEKTIDMNGPEILFGIGLAGSVVAAIMAVRATPKAKEELDKINDEDYISNKDKAVAFVKNVVPCYIPSMLVGAVSMGLEVKGFTEQTQRTLGFAASYYMIKDVHDEYKKATLDTVGKNKEASIEGEARRKVVEKRMENSDVYIYGDGPTPFIDCTTNQVFYAEKNDIEHLFNELTDRVRNEMYVSLNEYYFMCYEMLRLPDRYRILPTTIGDYIGFNADQGDILPSFTPDMTRDGKPALLVSYDVTPRWDYKSLQ